MSSAAALKFWEQKENDAQIPIWVDCDTGHDDAFAVLLAAHCPRLNLLGVSTVHGNSSLANTTRNTLSILEAIGKCNIKVYAGASKPFCREAAHAPDIHGESGLDGTTILPTPAVEAVYTDDNTAVNAMYEALSATPPKTAYLVATGALTNVGLLFAMYPSLAEHIAGLSIMGGAIGGFFTHAPIGRHRERVKLAENLSRDFPSGLPDDSDMSIADVAAHFRQLGLIREDDDMSDECTQMLLQQARQSFGNTTHYAEFNIWCDPEAASLIFANSTLAAKTTLIPLDVTHLVLGNSDILKMLGDDYSPSPDGDKSRLSASPVRHLFLEIMTFFAHTYEREFGMSDGPPLHDPIAVAAALAPEMFDDNDGERFEVYVVKEGGERMFSHQRDMSIVGQSGRTVAKMLPRGQAGVRIPRGLQVAEFWQMINLALGEAEKASSLSFETITIDP